LQRHQFTGIKRFARDQRKQARIFFEGANLVTDGVGVSVRHRACLDDEVGLDFFNVSDGIVEEGRKAGIRP